MNAIFKVFSNYKMQESTTIEVIRKGQALLLKRKRHTPKCRWYGAFKSNR